MASNPQGSVRRSFSIPAVLTRDLSFLAEFLGISKSALVSQLLGSPVSELRQLLSDLGPHAGAGAARFRGKSREVIEARIEALLREVRHELG